MAATVTKSSRNRSKRGTLVEYIEFSCGFKIIWLLLEWLRGSKADLNGERLKPCELRLKCLLSGRGGGLGGLLLRSDLLSSGS